jgi:hypothetical protein
MHAERHAARGGVEKDQLRSLIEVGYSIRSIAAELDLSYQTVRYWLRKHGLVTPRTKRLRITRAAAPEARVVLIPCPNHGLVEHGRRGERGYRCLKCRVEAVVQRRRRVKAALIAEHGGHCVICGFGAIPEALHFHHVDPSEKSFGLSARGLSRSISRARAEAAKCVLLCANCHAAVEAGNERLTLPFDSPETSREKIGPG